jgi:photosystem II stability/assembly factor-like uncharacterized protein
MPLKKRLCELLMAGIAVLAVGMQVRADDVFTPIGVGGGGAIFAPSISPHDPNLLFIGTDMGGCYRSIDGGKSWTQTHFSQLMSAAGADLSVRALILKDAVYWQGKPVWQSPVLKVSRDKGKTWQALAEKYPWQPKGVRHLAAIESPSLILFARNEEGMWRSEDGGKVWEAAQVGEEKDCRGIVVLADRVLATMGKSLVESRDRGKTWKALPIEAAKGKVLLSVTAGQDAAGTVIYAIAQDVGTLQSSDEGKNWAVVQKWQKQTDVQMAGNQTAIAFTAQSNNAGRNVFCTSDKGNTWEIVFPPDPKESKLDWVQVEMKWDYRLMGSGMSVSRTDPKTLMVSSIGDAYISRDAGKTWVPVTTADANLPMQEGNVYRRWKTNGLQVTGCYSFHVDPSDPKRLFAGHSDIGLLRSIDGGDTWSSLSYRGSPWRNSFYQLAFDPFDSKRIFAAASDTHDIPDWRMIDDLKKETGGVVISENGGDHWRKLWALSPEKIITSICVDQRAPTDKDHVVLYAAAYDDGVYKSLDSGKNWERTSKGLGNEGNMRVHRVMVHPKSGNAYAVIIGRKHGREFRVPGGLWRSVDGGGSWTDLTAKLKLMWPAGYFAIHPTDEKTILLTASAGPGCMDQGGVYKTTDGGATWKHVFTGPMAGKVSAPQNAVQCLDIRYSAADPNVIYLGTMFHGLWCSRDAGETWEPIMAFPHFAALSAQTDPLDATKIIVTTFGGGMWRGPALPTK